MNNNIHHEGYISRINDKGVTVSLLGNINCEGCKAQSACGVSDSNSKEIEIAKESEGYQLNERVDVVMQKELGLKAVLWAYVFPFFLMLLVLIISINFTNELMAGILSILILVPYYFIIHYFNNSFKEMFKISILKNN